jgi:D-cysteine desulfhydrase family pyridoxal phosphate-dependent enzyme
MLPTKTVTNRATSYCRVALAHLPTPLEEAGRLGSAIGLPHLWVKRDDCTGLAMGGNKARKLEYELGQAKESGADVLVTHGGLQSNHARTTAAAARRLGMEAVLLLTASEPAEYQGNLLLDRLFGAELHFLGTENPFELQKRIRQVVNRLQDAGRHPYVIPMGGATALGSMAYVAGVAELAEQLNERDLSVDAITVAVGSGGTLSGLMLGAHLHLPGIRLYGVSVGLRADALRRKCARLIAEAGKLLGVDWQPALEEIPVYDDWIGSGYGTPSELGRQAIALAAQTEGLLLDPIYTGKAFAGTRELSQRGEIHPNETVLFWHTGGTPALFCGSSSAKSPCPTNVD